MRLQLSPEDEAFREEMRTFFTTQVPQSIRDTVAAHRHLTKDQYVESQRTLNAAGLAVPHWPVEWGGRDWSPLQRRPVPAPPLDRPVRHGETGGVEDALGLDVLLLGRMPARRDGVAGFLRDLWGEKCAHPLPGRT